MNNKTADRPKAILDNFKDRTNGSLSPIFAWLVLFLFWGGVFVVLSLDGDKSVVSRLSFASVISLFIALPGFFLFQRCELSVNTHFVKWESHIVPRLWVERWQEPMKNYKCVALKRTKPIVGFWPPKYCADRFIIPAKRTGDNISAADIEFNKKTFVLVCLEHATDPKKVVALKAFNSLEAEKIDEYCSYLSDKLNIPVK